MHYPRMLFWQGTDELTCVVTDEAEQIAKVAAGWQTRPLPGEPGYGEPAAVPDAAPVEPPADAPPVAVEPEPEPPARKKPGPKPKPPTE